LGALAEDGRTGESIAVHGVCLTIAQMRGSAAVFELSTETLAKSTLGGLRPSAQVNIERAMQASDRFGGHFVLGHVDGTARIKSIDRHGQFADMRFETGGELLSQMVLKGSVAVDGISLTIASLDEKTFGVALIPETLTRTTLGKAIVGQTVNVEIDIIVKAIKRQLEKMVGAKGALTIEKLQKLGF